MNSIPGSQPQAASVADSVAEREPGLVSVIVPAYCAAGNIGRALASIFAQSYRRFEVIVINDGSPDTEELERVIAGDTHRLQYVRSAHTGPGGARNTGLLRSRGELVAFLDSDDSWLPDFLAEQVAFLEKTPSCDLVYCDAVIKGDTPLAGRRFMDDAPSERPVTLQTLILQRANVITSGVVARARALFAAGLFDASLKRGQDFDLWLRMAQQGSQFDFQRRVLVERSERSTGSPEDAIADARRVLRVLEKAQATMTLEPGAAQALASRIAWARDYLALAEAKKCLGSGDVAAARHHLALLRSKTLKARVALVLLQLAPGLIAAMYRRSRHASALVGRRSATSTVE